MAVEFRKDNQIGFVEFNQPDSKVNILTAEVLRRLDSLLDEIAATKDLEAVVFQSRKKDCFLAGADIKEIEQITEAEEGAAKAKAGQDIMNKIEDLPVPTVAVLDGVALGGGCELALACLYRVATYNPKIKIGLPEVNLGFVPGFGGTYRLPRTVGLAQGLTMILTGKPVDGAKALRSGLVDRLLPQAGLEKHLKKYLEEITAGAPKKRFQPKLPKGTLGLLERARVGQGIIFSQSRKNVLKETKGFYPAPLRAVDLVAKTYYMYREEALAAERTAFGELAVTEVSKNCVHVFYLSEKAKKLSVPGAEEVCPATVAKCGVLGAGVMGGGIAQLLASRDIWVRVKDLNYDAVALGLKHAAELFQKAVKRRRYTKAEAAGKMAHISGTIDYTGFKSADYIIEAVIENMEVKKAVFKELSGAAPANAILATNTSALSVTEMAEETQDPSKVIGFHFFNPVHRMPLVEVITTPLTSKETVLTSLNLAKRLGKTPILVKDSPGFIVNRILLAYMAEAGRVFEQTGDFQRIDEGITRFGMPMGPFLLSDEVGLDVGLKVMHILEEAFGERFKPVAVFEKLFERKELGKKTGKGFYIHGKKRVANPEVKGLLQGSFKQLHEDEIEQRLIFMMINEAARCLEEEIVKDPETIDAGMIFGTGFPPFRGGLLRYADTLTPGLIAERLNRFAEQEQAAYFKPCAYLEKLAQEKRTFYSR